jgi:hypothetical protein
MKYQSIYQADSYICNSKTFQQEKNTILNSPSKQAKHNDTNPNMHKNNVQARKRAHNVQAYIHQLKIKKRVKIKTFKLHRNI